MFNLLLQPSQSGRQGVSSEGALKFSSLGPTIAISLKASIAESRRLLSELDFKRKLRAVLKIPGLIQSRHVELEYQSVEVELP